MRYNTVGYIEELDGDRVHVVTRVVSTRESSGVYFPIERHGSRGEMIKKTFDGKASDLFTEFARYLLDRGADCTVQAVIRPEKEDVIEGRLVGSLYDKYRRQLILEDQQKRRFTAACVNATETDFAAQSITFHIPDDQCPELIPLSADELESVLSQLSLSNPDIAKVLSVIVANIDAPNFTPLQKIFTLNMVRTLSATEDRMALRHIIDILGLIDLEDSIGPLLEFLDHPDPACRIRAVLRFRTLSDLIKGIEEGKFAGIIEKLVKCTKSADDLMRVYSCEALGDILEGNKKDSRDSAVGALIEALSDNEDDVRWAASVALGRIGDPRPVVHLRHILNTDDYDFARMGAAFALGNIASIASHVNPSDVIVKEIREYLAKALIDPVPQIRERAIEFLTNPTNRRFLVDVTKELSPDMMFRIVADHLNVRPSELGTRIEKTDILTTELITGLKGEQYFVAHAYDEASVQDLRSAVEAALRGFGFVPFYADRMLRKGHILDKLATMIRSTAFGIYDISSDQRTETANPNVALELGMAITYGKPYILIARKGSKIISDLQGYDRIEYGSFRELTTELKKKILDFLSGSH